MHRANRALAIAAGLLVAAGPARSDRPRSRTFDFTYAGTVTGLKPGTQARVWLPVPPPTAEQDVKVVSRELPARAREGRDAEYDNRVLYFEARADNDGRVPFRITYRVTRREVRTGGKVGVPRKQADRQIKRFLEPDARVPIKGKPLELLKGKKVPEDPVRAGRMLYDLVNQHMTYAKDTPGWGQGDAVFACTAGRGNCSDFHSLFISLARSQHLPAKFEVGFPLPARRGGGDIPGYHCWAWFRPDGKGWIPVDISEANKNPKMADYYFGNLTADRVQFSTGRDLELAPRQDGPPVNFFIYPYAEVGGKTVPPARVKTRISFKDLPADRG